MIHAFAIVVKVISRVYLSVVGGLIGYIIANLLCSYVLDTPEEKGLAILFLPIVGFLGCLLDTSESDDKKDGS